MQKRIFRSNQREEFSDSLSLCNDRYAKLFSGMKKMAFLILLLTSALPVFAQEEPPRIIHVFVALCDNKYQGIVPVSAKLGNGDDPANNLYWGARYGVKNFFKLSPDWKLVAAVKSPPPVLERCVFKYRGKNVYLVADAYQGKQIKQAITDFLDAVSGKVKSNLPIQTSNCKITLGVRGCAQLLVYIGHNGLMDFKLADYPVNRDNQTRETIILACKSQPYFREAITEAGANPLLWTTGFMAPEAYTLQSAVTDWINRESDAKIQLRAAQAYNKYQKCGLRGATRLLATGF